MCAGHTHGCTQLRGFPTTVPRGSPHPRLQARGAGTTGRGNKSSLHPHFRAQCWSLLGQPLPAPPHCPAARHGDVRRLQAQPGSKHAHCPAAHCLASPQHTWPRSNHRSLQKLLGPIPTVQAVWVHWKEASRDPPSTSCHRQSCSTSTPQPQRGGGATQAPTPQGPVPQATPGWD